MTKPSKNLPKLLLRPDRTASNSNLMWIGISLVLVGLSADIASATSYNSADTISSNDIEAPREHDLPDGHQADTLLALTALQVKSSDDERSVPPLASQSWVVDESDRESIRFSYTGADLPDDHETADLVSQLADPESALSMLPSTAVQVEFEPSSVHRLPHAEPAEIELDSATETIPSQSQAANISQPSHTPGATPAASISTTLQGDRPSFERATQTHSTREIASASQSFPILEFEEQWNDSGGSDSDVNANQIAYSSNFTENSATDEINPDLDESVDGSLDASLNLQEDSDDADGLAPHHSTGITVSVSPVQEAYQSRNQFTFQPPVEVELPTSDAIAYNSDFTSPHASMPQVPTLGGSPIGTHPESDVSPLARSPHSVPLAHLHPSLPTASLDAMSLQEVQGVLPILIAVPMNPPMGRDRSGSDTLPPPPSLPVAAGVNVGTPAEQPQNYTAAIPIPQSYPREQATPASPDSIPLPVAVAPWTLPPPVAATEESFAGTHSSPNPVAFNPSAPFAPVTALNQSPAGQSVGPDRGNSGMNSSFESSDRISPMAFASQTPSVTPRSDAAYPVPYSATGAYNPNSPHSSAGAYNPRAPYPSTVSPLVTYAGAVFPSVGPNRATPPTFVPSDPFDPPVSHEVPLWQSGALAGQADPSLPVLIPVEPVFNTAQTAPFPSSQTPESTFPPPPTPPANVQQDSLTDRTPVTPPTLQLQGAGILVDDDFSARARLSGTYYLTPQILVGGALDLTEGTAFSDSETEGFNINELYLAASLRDLPNLRFVVGQLDLTSYFDRNSFAKDSLTHFFNPVFQTNPALAANAIGSRPGALINFSPTDNLDVRAAAFSSDRSIGDFDLDGFAGEVGFRVGNLILRGTYVSARDGGTNDGPPEIFGFDRGDDVFGIEEGDREESFGFNAELFIPEINMGLFGRYGRYENLDAGVSADTFSGGFNFLDVFMRNDRLGLAYGRALSNDDLRQERDDKTPDVVEVFYDFPLLSNPNTRLGVTLQQRDEFSETVAGIRIRTTFDILP
ncbi:MAG: hypothetical protein ACFE0J_23725 [Elainellaceae cyanobacterium]